MKLILCPHCQDVKKLQKEMTYCKCRKSKGKYLDDINAEVNDECIVLGFNNHTLVDAVWDYRSGKTHKNFGARFEAFIISKEADSIKMIGE